MPEPEAKRRTVRLGTPGQGLRAPRTAVAGATGVSPAEALATAVAWIRDGKHFDGSLHVPAPSLSFAEKLARLAAVVLPVDKHGVARDMWRAGLRGTGEVARSLTQPAERHVTVVSRKHRCVWLRVTKGASSSILAALLAADPDCTIVRVAEDELYALCPEARGWFTFAFLRHPFSRALSFWSELHFADRDAAVRRRKQDKRARKLDRCYGLAGTREFGDYCAWLHTPYGADAYTDVHVLSQSARIRGATCARGEPPDFIGRVEDLEADWSKVSADIGLPSQRLPLLNSVAGWTASERDVETRRAARALNLTETNKTLLAGRYAADLALGGYSATSLEVAGPVPTRSG